VTHPTRTDQAELRAARALRRGHHDPRTGDQYRADLEAEAERSLQADPTRWPWTTAHGGYRRRGWREQ